jgi:hypothetical protein
MAAQGTALLDFGAYPGNVEASIAVTGQAGILITSLTEAWIIPDVTADHSEDEHILEPVYVFIAKSSITAGVGFTIRGYVEGTLRVYGKFNIGWVWN